MFIVQTGKQLIVYDRIKYRNYYRAWSYKRNTCGYLYMKMVFV